MGILEATGARDIRRIFRRRGSLVAKAGDYPPSRRAGRNSPPPKGDNIRRAAESQPVAAAASDHLSVAWTNAPRSFPVRGYPSKSRAMPVLVPALTAGDPDCR